MVRHEEKRPCPDCGRAFIPTNSQQTRCSFEDDECDRIYEKKIAAKKVVVDSSMTSAKKVTLYLKKCTWCGIKFQTITHHQIYCSKKCRQDTYYTAPKEYAKKCAVCGRTFVTNNPSTLTCGIECRKMRNKSHKGNCVSCGKIIYGSYAVNKHKNLMCEPCRDRKKESYKFHMPTVLAEIKQKTENIIEHKPNSWHVQGFTKALKQAVKDRDGWQCYICHRETSLHVHHIIPRKHGGGHTMENLVTLCGGCHMSVESGNIDLAIKSCIKRSLSNI